MPETSRFTGHQAHATIDTSTHEGHPPVMKITVATLRHTVRESETISVHADENAAKDALLTTVAANWPTLDCQNGAPCAVPGCTGAPRDPTTVDRDHAIELYFAHRAGIETRAISVHDVQITSVPDQLPTTPAPPRPPSTVTSQTTVCPPGRPGKDVAEHTVPPLNLAEIERRLAARSPEENAARQARLDRWMIGRDAMTIAKHYLAAGDHDRARELLAIAARHDAPDAKTMLAALTPGQLDGPR